MLGDYLDRDEHLRTSEVYTRKLEIIYRDLLLLELHELSRGRVSISSGIDLETK